MERFCERAPCEACPKCGAAASSAREHKVHFSGSVLEVSCWRCGASLGSYLPMDAPEPRKRPSIPAGASVGPPRGDVDILPKPEE